jgi:hypothetical protein
MNLPSLMLMKNVFPSEVTLIGSFGNAAKVDSSSGGESGFILIMFLSMGLFLSPSAVAAIPPMPEHVRVLIPDCAMLWRVSLSVTGLGVALVCRRLR